MNFKHATLVRDQGFYFIDMPNMMLVREAIHWLTSFRIALIGQLPVTVNGK